MWNILGGIVVKLKIIGLDEYNRYHLINEDTNETYFLFLEFYGIKTPPAGSIIAIDERLLNPNFEGFCQPYAFKLCQDKTSMPKNDSEYIALKTGNFSYVLKRIYG